MKNYKTLPYAIRAKYIKSTEGGTGETSWNESLGLITLPNNADPTSLTTYTETIIDSFKNLMEDGITYDPSKQALDMKVPTLTELQDEIDEDPTAGIDIGSDTVKFTVAVSTTDNVGNKNSAKISGYFSSSLDSDTVPMLDTLCRALNGLTTRTYINGVLGATIYPLEV